MPQTGALWYLGGVMSDSREADTIDFEFPLVVNSHERPKPFSSLVTIDFGAMTHPGKKRPNNEDSYLYYRQGRFWERLDTSLEGDALPDKHEELAYVLAVADGMGGAAAGETASRMAITVAVNLILNAPNWVLKLDNPESRERELESARVRAQEYFRKIDEALLKQAAAYPALKGMGTTMTAARSVGDDLFTLHVGDSRCYLFRGGRLMRLTQDQTVAQALANQGAIPPEAVSGHWLRHRLTSVLGGQDGQLELEVRHTRLLDGDRLLLCTDGLTEMVKEPQIAAILGANETSAAACRALVAQALDAGGKDNVTVLVARYSLPR